MPKATPLARRSAGRMMVAVVLGAALGTINARAVEPDSRIVQDISRYCQACWRNARLPVDSWSDCTQEVFTRLVQRVALDRWTEVLKPDGDERREFVRAIDAVKKRVQRSRKCNALPDDVRDTRSANQPSAEWDAIAQTAPQVLSQRQWRILELSREGWSIPEIATDLGTSVARVSDEKYKAVRKLRQHLDTAHG